MRETNRGREKKGVSRVWVGENKNVVFTKRGGPEASDMVLQDSFLFLQKSPVSCRVFFAKDTYTSWGPFSTKGGGPEASDIIRHHQTSSDIITYHHTSSHIITHHHTSPHMVLQDSLLFSQKSPISCQVSFAKKTYTSWGPFYYLAVACYLFSLAKEYKLWGRSCDSSVSWDLMISLFFFWYLFLTFAAKGYTLWGLSCDSSVSWDLMISLFFFRYPIFSLDVLFSFIAERYTLWSLSAIPLSLYISFFLLISLFNFCCKRTYIVRSLLRRLCLLRCLCLLISLFFLWYLIFFPDISLLFCCKRIYIARSLLRPLCLLHLFLFCYPKI